MKTTRATLRLAAVLISLPMLLGSCSTSAMRMPEFGGLKPFKGRVTQVEKIDWKRDYTLHSASGPDFRVTVVRADGSTIVIDRIHTLLGQEDRLKKLIEKEQCNLPEEIVQCEDRIGKDRY